MIQTWNSLIANIILNKLIIRWVCVVARRWNVRVAAPVHSVYTIDIRCLCTCVPAITHLPMMLLPPDLLWECEFALVVMVDLLITNTRYDKCVCMLTYRRQQLCISIMNALMSCPLQTDSYKDANFVVSRSFGGCNNAANGAIHDPIRPHYRYC